MANLFEDLIKKTIPGLSTTILKSLLHELEGTAKGIAVDEAAKLTSRTLLKGVDTFVATAVKHLAAGDATKLSGAYLQVLTEQLNQLNTALMVYVPLQVGVEAAKRAHGDSSAEATAARLKRAPGIVALRQEVKDVLTVAAGGTPSD